MNTLRITFCSIFLATGLCGCAVKSEKIIEQRSDKETTASATQQEDYIYAFNLLKQKRYRESQKAFEDYIAKYPNTSDMQLAKYWYAQTLYAQKNFDDPLETSEDVLLAYANAYEESPQGSKASDCLLKMALIYLSTNKTNDACINLEKIIKDPNASSAVLEHTKELSQKLSCQGISK